VAVGLYSSTWGGACLRASDQNFSVICDIHYFNIYLLVYLTAIISVGYLSLYVSILYVGLRKTSHRPQAAAPPPPSPLPLYGTKCLNPGSNSVGRSVCTPLRAYTALSFVRLPAWRIDRSAGQYVTLSRKHKRRQNVENTATVYAAVDRLIVSRTSK